MSKTRRKLLIITVIVVVVVALFGAIMAFNESQRSNVGPLMTTGFAPSCWSTYQHDYQRTGYSDDAVPMSNATLWINPDVGGGGLIVADGRVFIYSGGYTYFIDASNGHTLWKESSSIGVQPQLTYYNGLIIQGTRSSGLWIKDFETGNSSFIRASNVLSVGGGAPIVDDKGIVYFSENHLQKTSSDSPDSTFFAYYLENRTKLWEFSLLNEQIGSSAALADGRIIFQAQHGLHALNVTNGQQLWMFSTSSGVGLSGVSLSKDGQVFAVGADGNIYALNQHDGSIVWQTQVADLIENPDSPAVGGGRVFVSDGYKLYALDAGKGSIIWSSSLGEIGSGPTVSGGLVFTASSSGVLYALKEDDGRIAWSLRLQLEHSGSISSAAICDGIVFIASEEGVRAVGAKP